MMKAFFKFAKLLVLAVGMQLESHQIPVVSDVRRQVQVNIAMASIYALLYYNESILQWANALYGLFLMWILDRVIGEPVRRFNIRRKDRSTSFKSLSPLFMWLLLYTVWNIVFATRLSGWTVALTHNGLPLTIVFLTGYSFLRTSKETAFYYWAFFRAICIATVELQFLGLYLTD